MKTKESSLIAVLVISLITLVSAGSLFAGTSTTWTGGASTTDWGTAGNWDTGVPTTSGTANLKMTTTYTVDYTGSSTIDSVVVANTSGVTTLNIAAVLTATNIFAFSSGATNGLLLNINSGGQLNMGASAQGQNATITINSGGLFSWGNTTNNNAYTLNDNGVINVNTGGQLLGFGGGSANNGMKLANGAGAAAINIAGGTVTMANMLMANRGTATINITSGGTMTLQTPASTGASLTMGNINNVNVVSALNVTNGSVTNVGLLYVGNGSTSNTVLTGTNTITVNGGTFNQTGTTYLGRGRVGILNVSSGSFAAASDIIIGGLDKNNVAPTTAVASGAVNISGGTLSTTALRVGDSIVVAGANAGYAVAGSLTLTGGTTTTGLLSAANGSNSVINFNGGSLIVSDTTNINNGSAFNVGNGTLVASVKLNGDSNTFANGLQINNNATLGGTGIVTGSATLLGGVIAPGTAGSPLTINGTVSLNSTAKFVFTLGGSRTSYDSLKSGAITLASGATLQLLDPSTVGTTFVQGNTVNLFLTTGGGAQSAFTGTFSTLLLPTLAGGLYWDSTQLYTLGELTVIPEPSTWAMLLGGLGMLVMGQRIRRRSVKA